MNRKMILMAAAGAGVIIVAALAIACCSRPSRHSISQQVALQPEYRQLQDKWNQYAKEYPAFMLMGDRGGTDENIIRTLNGWLAIFTREPGKEYLDELATLGRQYGETTFHAWEEFRRGHYRSNILELSHGMPETKLAEALNSYIKVLQRGRIPDHVTPETVRTIVYMHDLCAFFEGEKSNLHKRFIDTKIEHCQDLSTKGAYPALDALIK